MKKDKRYRLFLSVLVLIPALAFVVKFGGVALLKAYIETGIGNCQKNPVLCLSAEAQDTRQDEDIEDYHADFLPYQFPDFEISIPRGFSVVNEQISKIYYKKHKHRDKGNIIYILYKEPDFFVRLFPQLRKYVKDDYEFLSRMMSAKLDNIGNLSDALFVIVKGVFIPDLGSQEIKMLKFSLGDYRGFINYSLSDKAHYFDCNVFDKGNNFFKIYIKDKNASVDLDVVYAIISTLKKK